MTKTNSKNKNEGTATDKRRYLLDMEPLIKMMLGIIQIPKNVKGHKQIVAEAVEDFTNHVKGKILLAHKLIRRYEAILEDTKGKKAKDAIKADIAHTRYIIRLLNAMITDNPQGPANPYKHLPGVIYPCPPDNRQRHGLFVRGYLNGFEHDHRLYLDNSGIKLFKTRQRSVVGCLTNNPNSVGYNFDKDIRLYMDTDLMVSRATSAGCTNVKWQARAHAAFRYPILRAKLLGEVERHLYVNTYMVNGRQLREILKMAHDHCGVNFEGEELSWYEFRTILDILRDATVGWIHDALEEYKTVMVEHYNAKHWPVNIQDKSHRTLSKYMRRVIRESVCHPYGPEPTIREAPREEGVTDRYSIKTPEHPTVDQLREAFKGHTVVEADTMQPWEPEGTGKDYVAHDAYHNKSHNADAVSYEDRAELR